jgi:predicted RNA-binding Zn-ribbon protein involved in translation (DUF1610 family)
MSLTADLTERRSRVIGGSIDPSARDRAIPDQDVIEVTCAACNTRQTASGRALGYSCRTCGSDWRVLRCKGCRKASIVLAGISVCPRCGHDHHARPRQVTARQPSWLTEPDPLSVWIGGVRYLGGHGDRVQPLSSAGLLLDRRGIHLRAFSELFTMRWDTVRGIDIEGPQDITERLTVARLKTLGATTWALKVAYLTVHTANGDAIFEVDGLGPPELHARLSRVLQGLQRAEPTTAPITIERPRAGGTDLPPVTEPAPVPSTPSRPEPLTIDPSAGNAPIEILVIDALWKLAHLREVGLLDDGEVRELRSQLLARLPSDSGIARGTAAGPLLHV